MKLLLIDHDTSATSQLSRALSRTGYDVRVCAPDSDVVDTAGAWFPDVLVVDPKATRMPGVDIVRALKRVTPAPIIVVCSDADVPVKVAMLDAGASDYVVKPFDAAELCARVRAATRSLQAPTSQGAITVGRLRLDTSARRAYLDGHDLNLSAKEFELLLILSARPGQVVERRRLTFMVWGLTPDEAANTLDVHISWLRKKLGDDPKTPRYIETIRGRGFRFSHS